MPQLPRANCAALARVALWTVFLCTAWMVFGHSPAEASIRRHHFWQAAAFASPTDPQKDAELVVDGETGRVLFARNADAPRHPASLTKMMTMYLLFEQLKSGQMTLATPISISQHAAMQAPTKLHLRPGATIPVDTAIKAAVVLSANDVAVAIAEAIGGTESHFAEMMTAKARALGMTHTYFHNASGLPDDLQITSASDLAVLARHLAYDFPQYYHYFSTYSFSFRGYTIFTHDNLIGRYNGADGIKTGYTGASGFNLVSSVVRGGVHVIGVVMGGRTAHGRDAEMMHLLDNTFVAINQNPALVARANVPWQALASNVGARPIVAGFPLGGAATPPPVLVPPAQTANDDFADEDAAESQSDMDDRSPSHSAFPPSAPPPSTPPRNVVASLGQATSAAVIGMPVPPSPAPATRPGADAPHLVTVNVLPKPRPAVAPTVAVVASIAVPPIVPRPRPAPTVADYEPSARPNAISTRDTETGRKTVNIVLQPTLAASGGDWTIQIGAYGDAASAKAELETYAQHSLDVLGQTTRIVAPFQSAEGQTLYRARFGPFGERQAREVCQRLTARGQTCFAALAAR